MTTLRSLAVLLFATLLPATLPAAPTAVAFQGVTIGAKLRTSPVDFRMKVGLGGGSFLAPGLYDVEVASTGDKSRVMVLFFQKGRKMGEAPGTLKPAVAHPGGTRASCTAPAACGEPSKNPGGTQAECAPAAEGAKRAPRYLSFEQLGFAGGVKPSLRAGPGGGTLLTIPGAGGASVEAQLPAAR